MRKAVLLLIPFLMLSFISPISAVESASGEETIPTHLFVLAGHPEGRQSSSSAPRAILQSGGTLRLADTQEKTSSEEARQIIEKSLSFSQATEKLWATFRLDPNRKKQEEFHISFPLGKSMELPIHDIPVSISVNLLRMAEATPVYRIVFRHREKIIADSTVEAARGGRTIIGAMDGEEAPYLFLFLEPEKAEKNPVRISEEGDKDITAPRQLSQTPVFYPEEAKKAGIQGKVILEVTIDTEGKVVDVVVLQTPDESLGKAAKESVSQWRFSPALTRDGKAVSVRSSVTIRFALK